MKPILFEFSLPLIGKITLSAFFTMLSLSLVIGILFMERGARKLKINPLRMYDMGIFIILFALIGARFLHVIADGQFKNYVNLCTNPRKVEVPPGPGGPDTANCLQDKDCGKDFLCNNDKHTCYPKRDCLIVFKVWRGGLVFYGGFIFAALFAWWYIKKHKLPFWKIADLMAWILPFGLFIGRLGCTLHGCCYGKTTNVPWAIRYLAGRGPYDDHLKDGLINYGDKFSLYVHPTQLYSASINLFIFFIVYFWLRSRKKFDGQLFAFTLIAYSLGRSFVEIFRADPRGNVLFLSTSQFIGIFMFLTGVWIYVKKPGNKENIRNLELINDKKNT